jgi:galactose mutarotase-like enzyme
VDGHGVVEVLRDDEAVVARYPKEMWAGNPVLFPMVSFTHLPGAQNHYEWEGRRFPMPQHGFARRSRWTVADRAAESVTLELVDSPETLEAYPFRFRYGLTYRLAAGRLHWEQRIGNRSDVPMPYGSGFHPYIRLPLGPSSRRDDCHVRCPRGIRYNPVGLSEAYFTEPFLPQEVPVSRDVAGTIQLGDLAAREFALVDLAAGLQVVLNWEDAPDHRFCALWSRTTQSDFYCIEPWTALPNAFGRPDDREIRVLAPGEVSCAAMWIDVRAV